MMTAIGRTSPCLTIGVFSIPLINGLPQEMEEVTWTEESDGTEKPLPYLQIIPARKFLYNSTELI